MTHLAFPRGISRQLWAGLREDRFTNADVVLLAAAGVLTALIGVLGVTAFLR